jgi:hypothetical protein
MSKLLYHSAIASQFSHSHAHRTAFLMLIRARWFLMLSAPCAHSIGQLMLYYTVRPANNNTNCTNNTVKTGVLQRMSARYRLNNNKRAHTADREIKRAKSFLWYWNALNSSIYRENKYIIQLSPPAMTRGSQWNRSAGALIIISYVTNYMHPWAHTHADAFIMWTFDLRLIISIK